MVWAKLDDAILDNPKIASVGPIGFALHIAAITYCARNLTDGFVPYGTARRLLSERWVGPAVEPSRIPPPPGTRDAEGVVFELSMTSGMTGWSGLELIEYVIGVLVLEELWSECPGGYQLHDYLEYNPSREEVLAEREEQRAQRSAAGKASAASRRQRFGTAQPTKSERTSERDVERPVRARSERSLERDIERSPNPVPVPVPVPVETHPSSEGRVFARAREDDDFLNLAGQGELTHWERVFHQTAKGAGKSDFEIAAELPAVENVCHKAEVGGVEREVVERALRACASKPGGRVSRLEIEVAAVRREDADRPPDFKPSELLAAEGFRG